MISSMKFFILLLSLWVGLIHADENLDLRFLQTQRTKSNPFQLPFSVNSKGEFSAFGNNGTDIFAFNPLVQVGFSKVEIDYSQPIMMDRFNFYPVQKELGWIEVKRLQVEAGLGLSALMKSAFFVGLTPYKGAMRTLVRYKNSKDEKSLPFKMPRDLNEVARWHEGDFGTFQTYGGIQINGGISVGVVDIATVSLGLQNQFIIEIKKISPTEVLFSLAEEDLKRRQMVIGPFVTDVTVAQFKGRRLSAIFKLNLEDPTHHELFKAGMNGNIQHLQEVLPHENQKLLWQGYDRSFYYGIPIVAGKTRMRGHYNLNQDDLEAKLDIRGSKTQGLLTPLRNHDQFVYQTKTHIIMVWASEMNKVTSRTMEQNFFSKGRAIGIKGFDREIPGNLKYGSVVSQIGVTLSLEEVEKVKGMEMAEFEAHLTMKCETENLSCKKSGVRRKLISDMVESLKRPWANLRGQLGLLLMKEPAMFHSIVKTLRLEKEAYFKFLSEKYQSIEGSAEVEI